MIKHTEYFLKLKTNQGDYYISEMSSTEFKFTIYENKSNRYNLISATEKYNRLKEIDIQVEIYKREIHEGKIE